MKDDQVSDGDITERDEEQPRRRRSASRPAGAPSDLRAGFSAGSGAAASVTTLGEARCGTGDEPADAGVREGSVAVVSRPPAVMAVFQPPPEMLAPAETSDPASVTEGSEAGGPGRRRRRGGRNGREQLGSEGGAESEGGSDSGDGSGDSQQAGDGSNDASDAGEAVAPDGDEVSSPDGTGKRRRRRRRRGSGTAEGSDNGDSEGVRSDSDRVAGVQGSTRLEAKRQRRRDGREAVRRRSPVLSEAEFLARRESVERRMLVKGADGRMQIAVLEDGVLAEHYVSRLGATSLLGSIFLGKVQNVLPSMEAAFVDIGQGRNGVLYAGEVDWGADGLEGRPRRIEVALSPGDSVLVQVTKDPAGQKGARLTGHVSFAGRHLVFVPGRAMSGISRRLPDKERARLRKLLQQALPEGSGVIVRTAAEGASEDQIRADIARLTGLWEEVVARAGTARAPERLYAEPDLAVRVVRDMFNEDICSLSIAGDEAADAIEEYVGQVSPELADRVRPWTGSDDIFAANRVDEQLAKALSRKVWLPSGGSLVIDRTEAMTVVDVNTGKFTGTGGNLEETVTRNNLEAAEEIVRQLRLRDIGGIIVIDFIDMVLERNRDLVVRRLVECLGRDRTKHQVAEVTSLGLVQMTRKRIGQGLLETFSEVCDACEGRGLRTSMQPVEPRESSGRFVHRVAKAAGPIPGAPTPSSKNQLAEEAGADGDDGDDEVDLTDLEEEVGDEDLDSEEYVGLASDDDDDDDDDDEYESSSV